MAEGTAVDVVFDREGNEVQMPAPAFSVPDEFKEKPYMKDIDSPEKLYKAFDGLQTKLGERPAGIPGENATDEERLKFNTSFGVPESFEKYSRVELPEGAERNNELDAKLMGIVHKAGISDAQFKIMEPGFNEIMGELAKQKQDGTAANDVEFDKLAGEVFKDNRDAALAASNKLLAAHVPEQFKADLATLPNRSLLIMAGVLDSIRQKYISEDTPPGGPSGNLPPTTNAEISAEARRLMATKEYTDPFHANHKEMVQKVNDLYKGLKKS